MYNVVVRFHSTKTGGFTLIELLVVISIVSLLASTVLVATSKARTTAKVGRMKAEFTNLRTSLELYYQSSGNTWGSKLQLDTTKPCPSDAIFTGTMFEDTNIKSQLADIVALFPGATMQCIAASDFYSGNLNIPPRYWSIMIQDATAANKWCFSNYDIVSGDHNIFTAYLGAGQTQNTIGGSPPAIIVTRCVAPSPANTDWK